LEEISLGCAVFEDEFPLSRQGIALIQEWNSLFIGAAVMRRIA
jgi:hypothetical protein